jgi:hypothetical protein
MGRFADTSGYATIHLQSNLGSFKTRSKEPNGKAEGRFDIQYSGSLLVSGLEGNIQVGEGLVKEFDDMGRQVYHGTGRIVVEGKWRALQWFGSGMSATWYGSGLINVIGEFDQNLQTGYYWYDDPEKKGMWPSVMMTYAVPELPSGVSPDVVPQRRGGQGGN